MKKITFALFFLLSFHVVQAQVLSNLRLTTGFINSDIDLPHNIKSLAAQSGIEFENLNTGKIGFHASLATDFSILKVLKINTTLSYQERWPLEFFRLNVGNTDNQILISQFDTSPQSDEWDESMHKRFPNFKYLHFEVVPMINRGGERLTISVGAGLFYGYLLNHNKLVFTGNDFSPLSLNSFTSGMDNKVAYQQHDAGWMLKMFVDYAISDKIEIGAMMKYYFSRTPLDKYVFDEANKFDRQNNTNWIVFAAGLSVKYHFSND